MVAAPGTLFVVATPIGNLEDLSPRAARVLREADVVAAEDTRRAQHLLGHADAGGAVNPARRLVSLFEGNEAARSEAMAGELAAGRTVALISDAGTPAVSDPGERLVRAAIALGARVEPVPGPVAAVTALVASGLPAARFTFLGFPPREDGARRQLVGELRGERATMIFYEAPDRVAATLAALRDGLGDDRRACLSRELTKVYEEHVRGTLAELAVRFAEAAPRGECTLVVEGAAEAAAAVDVDAEVRRLLADGLSPREVAARLVVVTGKPRRQLYQLALALGREAARGREPEGEVDVDGDGAGAAEDDA
ncbi:MAG: 16S rRNA (cytidine(1402)-2'-O)-methyltransferase [Kofleriaceae bacterium]|nr:16S rRNA (cytidine(1402)-2'-O)-methyltransferase [Kofleriaceae bacterium]MCB9573437.1 16S rRNA (cytidine(1402)-2'-O)-methyltransferase [Kofleriaceae bacterium]